MGWGVPWDFWADGSVQGAHQELTPGLALPTREGAGAGGSWACGLCVPSSRRFWSEAT